MSHSEALSRLTVGNMRCEMIRWVLRRAVDNVEREWNCDASQIGDMVDASTRRVSGVTDLLAAALVTGFGLAAPAAAYASVQPAAASVYTMSPGRIGAMVG